MLRKMGGFLLLMVTLVLVACGNNATEDVSSDKTEIRFAYWGGDFDQTRMENIKAAFEEQNDSIEVELVNVPGDEYGQHLLTRFASGDVYDIVQLAENSYYFATRGVLEDLTPWAEEDDDFNLDDFYEVGIEAYSHNDRLYGLPLRLGTVMMFYNKDLLDQHGLDYPDENSTWEEIIEMAETITNPSEGVFGMNPLGGWWASTSQFTRSHGVRMLSEDFTEFQLDSPEGIDAIEKMRYLVNDLNIAPNDSQIPEGIDLWTSGRQGFLIDGPWHILSSRANIEDFEWDMTSAPTMPGVADTAPTFSNAFHIANASTNKDAAWEVIKFWTGVEGQEILASEHAETPSRRSVAESDAYLEIGDMGPENFASTLEAVEGAYPPEASLMWSEINEEVQNRLSRIINLEEPVDVEMKALRNDIEPLLEEQERLLESFE
ncbi:sugar ABC transporter substrate-binding protein [Halalkalibacter sp. APA_J-10(15)]|uniref:ABC transporter substrate-binding protein n=1 Tax=Halalkalibacter sp. APA_J-10(15) TaxID=2933805 RepID=UPI001FF4603E|nr:sugar ABC transporter substrate-binding protein [Halalkalibacter sp. APA_J-10(15)]MCK0473261.1 sugar ABC transporter substrate-binding protein [Halalkalibacter sp. APA_J-10(15)]